MFVHLCVDDSSFEAQKKTKIRIAVSCAFLFRPEDANTKRTRTCIEACHIGQLLPECRFLRTESLHELLKALSLAASRGTCTHDVLPSAVDTEAASVFAFEFLLKVVLNNRYA